MSSDNHSHILYDSISSMVNSAFEKNFQVISITEHISQFTVARSEIKFGSVHASGRIFRDFHEYIFEFLGFDGRVRKGLEVDFSTRYEKQVSKFVNQGKWDFLLFSVHELRNGLDIELKGLPQDHESSISRWKEYIALLKEALESDSIPYNVVTHPVRLARSTPLVPENLDDLFLELGELAKREDKALELNGNDIARDYPLVERLARACSEARCKVSFGSDAHHPNEVGRGFEKAQELIERFRLSQVF